MERLYEKKNSFRPLTGILFSNAVPFPHDSSYHISTFPSPHGDFVFERFNTRDMLRTMEDGVSVPSRGFCFRTLEYVNKMLSAILKVFPSPHGDFVFEPGASADVVVAATFGFRPLTGILFSNARSRGFIEAVAERSFRPLTGILFSNSTGNVP